jgi:hypothetical protein
MNSRPQVDSRSPAAIVCLSQKSRPCFFKRVYVQLPILEKLTEMIPSVASFVKLSKRSRSADMDRVSTEALFGFTCSDVIFGRDKGGNGGAIQV